MDLTPQDGETPTPRAEVQITKISVGMPGWLRVESTSEADSATGRAAAVLLVALAETSAGVISSSAITLLGGPPWLIAVISISNMTVTTFSAHQILRLQNKPDARPDTGGSS